MDDFWLDLIRQGGPFAGALALLVGGAIVLRKYVVEPVMDKFGELIAEHKECITETRLAIAAAKDTAVICRDCGEDARASAAATQSAAVACQRAAETSQRVTDTLLQRLR